MPALRLEARPIARATRKNPGDFHRLLWANWLRPWVRNRLPAKCNEQVLARYFDEQADRGFALGTWGSSEEGFTFEFDDDGGKRALSAKACTHWVELALARFSSDPQWRAWADDCGYEAAPGARVQDLLPRGPAIGLIELRKVLHGVARITLSTDEPRLFTDAGVKCAPFAALPKGTRVRVTRVAHGLCACELCDSVRAEQAKRG